MTNSLTDRIRNTALTKSQRKIADYFMNNMEKIGGMSSLDAAHAAGVSDASIIRFARALGFKGFADLKDYIYNMLVENAFGGMSLSERVEKSSADYGSVDPFTQFQQLMIQNIARTFKANAGEDFERAADMLVAARRRYIIGLRGCKGITTTFSRLLAFMLPNVFRLTDAECTSISALQDSQPGDCVVMFAFSRLYKMDIFYRETAKKHGCRVCLVTNNVSGRLAELVDLTLSVTTNGMSFFHSTMGITAIGEYLLTLIGRKVDYKARIDERDAITAHMREALE